MAKWEKAVTVLCFVYVIAYAVYFFTVVMAPGVPESRFLAPLHFLAMALSLIMVILVVRDVYRRPFPGSEREGDVDAARSLRGDCYDSGLSMEIWLSPET